MQVISSANKKVFTLTFLIVIWCFVTISNILTHLTNDFFVFWGWAQQVSNSQYTGLDSIINTWEIKGILARICYYEFYSLTTLFYDGFDLVGQAIYKTIALLQFNILLYISIILIPTSIFSSDKINRLYLFFTASSCLSCSHFSVHLQPEFLAIPFLLIATSLALHAKRRFVFLGGVIYALTFYLKSPIAIMGGSIFFSILLLKKEPLKTKILEFLPFIGATIGTLLLTFFILYKCYPIEISDMMNASQYQHTLIHNSSVITVSWLGDEIDRLFDLLWQYMLFIPVIAIGLAMSFIYIMDSFLTKKYPDILFIILLWLFPLAYIVISQCYFIYHFYLLCYPTLIILFINRNQIGYLLNKNVVSCAITIGIIGVILSNDSLNTFMNLWQKYIFAIGTILVILPCIRKTRIFSFALLLSFLAFIVGSFLWFTSYNVSYGNKSYQTSVINNSKKGIEVGGKYGDNKLLFLDAGLGCFWFSNQSQLRYVYPLPIQRTSENSEFAKSETFKSTHNSILNFKDGYIVLDRGWFFAKTHSEIEEFIDQKWEKVEDLNCITFSWDFYAQKPTNNLVLEILKHTDE